LLNLFIFLIQRRIASVSGVLHLEFNLSITYCQGLFPADSSVKCNYTKLSFGGFFKKQKLSHLFTLHVEACTQLF